jgi:hypothetical protein
LRNKLPQPPPAWFPGIGGKGFLDKDLFPFTVLKCFWPAESTGPGLRE